MRITPVGQMFLTKIESALLDIERAVKEVNEYLDPEKGEIRIGFLHSLSIHILPSVVAAYRKKHPDVKFLLHQGNVNKLLEDMGKGEIDLAFVSPVVEDKPEVIGKKLFTEALYAIIPAGHPLAERTSIRLNELARDPFVLFRKGYTLRAIAWEACLKAGFEPEIAFEAEETDTIRGLVAAGMGVGLLPEVALMEVDSKNVIKMRIEEPKVTRTVGIINYRERPLPPAAQLFYKFVEEYFAGRE